VPSPEPSATPTSETTSSTTESTPYPVATVTPAPTSNGGVNEGTSTTSETSTTSSGGGGKGGGGGSGGKTPAPTHHSAKKWEMLHPDYKGGDGELLWNIYYGDLADDERFDAFRKDQLWDADVVRPMIEMDIRYKKFHLRNQNINVSGGKTSTSSGYQWLVVAGLAVLIVAAYCVWKKRPDAFIKLVDRDESMGLLQQYQSQY